MATYFCMAAGQSLWAWVVASVVRSLVSCTVLLHLQYAACGAV